MRIEIDDLSRTEVQELLTQHVANMHALSPPGSVHTLGWEDLQASDVTVWTVWDDDGLAGCGALKALSPRHGEVKSMRTCETRRNQGVGRLLLAHIVDQARHRGYERLSLETGSAQSFAPARRLYEGAGFCYCDPFGSYAQDPHSVFMTLAL